MNIEHLSLSLLKKPPPTETKQKIVIGKKNEFSSKKSFIKKYLKKKYVNFQLIKDQLKINVLDIFFLICGKTWGFF